MQHSLNTYRVPPPCQARNIQKQRTPQSSVYLFSYFYNSHNFLVGGTVQGSWYGQKTILTSKLQCCEERLCTISGLQPCAVLGALRHCLIDTSFRHKESQIFWASGLGKLESEIIRVRSHPIISESQAQSGTEVAVVKVTSLP